MNQIIIKIIQKFYLEKIKKKKNDFFLLNLMKKLIIQDTKSQKLIIKFLMKRNNY